VLVRLEAQITASRRRRARRALIDLALLEELVREVRA
jgi:hypothetical protein